MSRTNGKLNIYKLNEYPLSTYQVAQGSCELIDLSSSITLDFLQGAPQITSRTRSEELEILYRNVVFSQ